MKVMGGYCEVTSTTETQGGCRWIEGEKLMDSWEEDGDDGGVQLWKEKRRLWHERG